MTRKVRNKQAPSGPRRMPPALKYRIRSVVKGKKMKPRMREWLEELLEKEVCRGLTWKDKKNKIFEIMWYHASNHAFDPNEHADLFIRYAELTGNKVKGIDKNKNKKGYDSKLKSNFRSALHSLPDCIRVCKEGAVVKKAKGENSVMYQFIEHTHPEYKRKKAAKNKGQRKNKTKTHVKIKDDIKEDIPATPEDYEPGEQFVEEFIQEDWSQQSILPFENISQLFNQTVNDNTDYLLPENEFNIPVEEKQITELSLTTEQQPYAYVQYLPTTSSILTPPSTLNNLVMQTAITVTSESATPINSHGFHHPTDIVNISSVACDSSTDHESYNYNVLGGEEIILNFDVQTTEISTLQDVTTSSTAENDDDSSSNHSHNVLHDNVEIHEEQKQSTPPPTTASSIDSYISYVPNNNIKNQPLPDFNALGVDDTFEKPKSHRNNKMSCGGTVRVKKEKEETAIYSSEDLSFLDQVIDNLQTNRPFSFM